MVSPPQFSKHPEESLHFSGQGAFRDHYTLYHAVFSLYFRARCHLILLSKQRIYLSLCFLVLMIGLRLSSLVILYISETPSLIPQTYIPKKSGKLQGNQENLTEVFFSTSIIADSLLFRFIIC